MAAGRERRIQACSAFCSSTMSRRSCKACAPACGSSGAPSTSPSRRGPRRAWPPCPRARYDVVVADMRMPAMDGASFLRIVMEQQPEVVRIVLSGLHRPGQRAARAGRRPPVSQQALPHRHHRRGAVARVVAAQPDHRRAAAPFHVPAHQPAGRAVGLRAARRDPDPSRQQRGQPPADRGAGPGAVGQAAAGRELEHLGAGQAGGDAGRGGGPPGPRHPVRPGPVELPRAERRAGARRCPGCRWPGVHEHALLSARIARRLMAHTRRRRSWPSRPRCWRTPASSCSGCGGPSASPWSIEACRSGVPPREAEQLLFGFTHAEVGAYLLGLWGLPPAAVEAVAFHHEPRPAARAASGRAARGGDRRARGLRPGRRDAAAHAGRDRAGGPGTAERRGARPVGRAARLARPRRRRSEPPRASR